MCAVEKDLVLKEACWLELEAELQSRITSLEKELELEREQHNQEVEKRLRPPDWCHLIPPHLHSSNISPESQSSSVHA